MNSSLPDTPPQRKETSRTGQGNEPHDLRLKPGSENKLSYKQKRKEVVIKDIIETTCEAAL
jgi:hypothetical protein